MKDWRYLSATFICSKLDYEMEHCDKYYTEKFLYGIYRKKKFKKSSKAEIKKTRKKLLMTF